MSASRGRRKAVRTSTGQFVAGKNGTEETATVTPTTTAVVLATAAIAPAAAANTADSSATPAVSTARRAAVPSAFGLGKGQGRKATDATAAATAVSERGRGKQPATPEARATAPDKADKATDSKAGISLPEKAEVFEIESSDDDDDIEIDEVGNGVSVPASNERPLDLAGKHLPDSLKLVTVIELTEVIHVFEGMVAFVDNQGREWCIHKSSPPLRPGGGYSPHTGVPEFRPKSLDHFGRMSETVRSSAHVWKVESKEQVNITPMVRGSGFQISPFPQTSKRWDTEGANSHPFPFYIVNYTPAFVAAVIAAVSAVEDVIHAGDLTASSGGGGGAPAVEPASTPSLAGPTPAPSKDGYKEASDHFEAMHVMNANFLKRLFPDHPSERASVDGTDSAMTCKLLRAELATKHGQLVSMTEERDRARSRGDSLQTTSVRDITALESVVTNLDRDCKAAASSVAALELTIKNLQASIKAKDAQLVGHSAEIQTLKEDKATLAGENVDLSGKIKELTTREVFNAETEQIEHVQISIAEVRDETTRKRKADAAFAERAHTDVVKIKKEKVDLSEDLTKTRAKAEEFRQAVEVLKTTNAEDEEERSDNAQILILFQDKLQTYMDVLRDQIRELGGVPKEQY